MEVQRRRSREAELNLSNSDIARILHCPAANVELYWTEISDCLDSLHIGSDNSKIAALATIAVETAHTFAPVHEYGSDALHEKEYGFRKDLGNIHAGDGARYAGNGFIQTTGLVNYERLHQQLGIDCVNHPEELRQKDAACAAFAVYWHDKKCDIYADSEQWTTIRHKVNGGENNLAEFLRYVNDLKTAIAEKGMAANA